MEQHQRQFSDQFVKSLGQFFQRDLISIPLIKKYPHNQITQRCGLKAATLELDTAAFPNIEYIAGDRLSIYPVNPSDHVNVVMKHILDDISPLATSLAAAAKPPPPPHGSSTTVSPSSPGPPGTKRPRMAPTAVVGPRMSDPWAQFVATNGKDSVRLALTHLYDITTAPSRDLLRIMAENCSEKEHKTRLVHLSKNDDIWERWVCQNLRTLKSTFEEFSSCKISAKSLFSELHLQQPRQYSISSIKSSKRFRTEIIVMQHNFDQRLIANHINILRDHELLDSDSHLAPKSPQSASIGPTKYQPTTVHVNHLEPRSMRSLRSVRSLRPMISFGTSPISMQQVKRVPPYSGPLMSLYAQSSVNATKSKNSIEAATKSLCQGQAIAEKDGSSSQPKQFEGLCSHYLLNLSTNESIVCEFVENPRFTMKGNRERPIMMIGQDIGVLAFRAFWQQRALEHDRAQIFYDLFKDLSPKKFGDMQLVCVTGSKCKIEDLFRREINSVVTQKVLSSVTYVNKTHLMTLLNHAAAGSLASSTSLGSKSNKQSLKHQSLPIESKELISLGSRIAKLLTEGNGCLYTCCDAQMTQAIEMLAVESISRLNSSLSRETIMSLIPRWKGRKSKETMASENLVASKHLQQTFAANTKGEGQKFLFTLENPFEMAQIVQEVYNLSL